MAAAKATRPTSIRFIDMTYKFEKLEVYQLALDHLDLIYALADSLPRSEEYNLRSQIIRAATSIVGSTLRRCNWRKPKPVAKSFLPRFKRCGDHLNDRRRVDDGGPMTVDRTRSAVQRLHMRSAAVRLPSSCRPRPEVKQGEVVGITRASLSVARASRSLPH
jgi:hypothetical protein